MKPMTLPTATEECIPHRVYDLSIPDVKDRKERSLVFRSGLAAANYLGINPKHFYDSRNPGKRVHSKKHNKKFAVRIEKENVMVPAMVNV